MQKAVYPNRFYPSLTLPAFRNFIPSSNPPSTSGLDLGEEKDLTLTHVKSAAALASKTMRKLKQKEYLVDASPIVSLYGIDSVYDLTTGFMLGLYHYEGHYSKVQPKYDFKAYLQGFEDDIRQRFRKLSTSRQTSLMVS